MLRELSGNKVGVGVDQVGFASTLSIRCSICMTGILAILLIQSLGLCLFPLTSYADGGFPIIGVLHAGRRPEGIAVDTQTHMVYIAYEFSSLIVGFDPIGGKVRWQVSIGDSSTEVQVDSVSHRVYVLSSSNRSKQGLLTILDGATGKILLSTASESSDNGLAIDTKRERFYVSDNGNGVVNAFSLAITPQTGQLSAGPSLIHVEPHPDALGVNSHLGRLYVGDAVENHITVINEDSGHIVATIPVASAPLQPIRVDEATGRVYALCSNGQELDVIDGNTNTVIARVPISPYPEGVAFNTATGRIYVANEGNRDGTSDQNTGTSITVIDGRTFDVLGTLQVGRGPDGVEADPLLHRVYVTVEDSDAMVEVSDAVDIPLQVNTSYQQNAVAHQAILFLQQATLVTVIVMFLTIAGATIGALSPRWRVQGSPRMQHGTVSSRLKKHSPPA